MIKLPVWIKRKENGLISSDKIEAWRQEVEERPASAPMIIDFISRRLKDLTQRNEELLAENIALRSGHKVEEYESRIANLEYQLDLLKRQFSGAASILEAAQTVVQESTVPSLLLYNSSGQVLRLEFEMEGITSGIEIARLARVLSEEGQAPPRILVASAKEELLFTFDSGRTQTMPVQALPLNKPEGLQWEGAFLVEPRGLEELAVVTTVGRMTLYDLCIQVSRRGYVKKLQESFFETCVANGYVGTGVKLATDETCSLVLCKSDDLFVMVSQEGATWCMESKQLPFTIEEVLRLGPIDHIVTAFTARPESTLLVITQNGKVLQREMSWLTPAVSFKARGQFIISQARREAGIRVIGAAIALEQDVGIALHRDGKLSIHRMSDLFTSGSLGEETVDLVDFMILTSK